jgi:hypothetical protein
MFFFFHKYTKTFINAANYVSYSIILIILMSFLIDASQTCTKFGSEQNKVVGMVNGVCYYGLTYTMQWDTAQTRCQSEGMHLVHLENVIKQLDIFNALGTKRFQTLHSHS